MISAKESKENVLCNALNSNIGKNEVVPFHNEDEIL